MKTKKNNLNDLLNYSLSEKQLIVIKGGGEPVPGTEVFVEQEGNNEPVDDTPSGGKGTLTGGLGSIHP